MLAAREYCPGAPLNRQRHFPQTVQVSEGILIYIHTPRQNQLRNACAAIKCIAMYFRDGRGNMDTSDAFYISKSSISNCRYCISILILTRNHHVTASAYIAYNNAVFDHEIVKVVLRSITNYVHWYVVFLAPFLSIGASNYGSSEIRAIGERCVSNACNTAWNDDVR